MIISGLVITLNADPALAGAAIEALQARPDFEVGERNGRWLSAAMETPDDQSSRALHDWLQQLPGVDFTDVVHVQFEAESA